MTLKDSQIKALKTLNPDDVDLIVRTLRDKCIEISGRGLRAYINGNVATHYEYTKTADHLMILASLFNGKELENEDEN